MRRIPRPVRIAINIALSAGVLAYLIWQIDLGRTIDEIASANGWLLLAAFAVFAASTFGMAWRWQLLLVARGIVWSRSAGSSPSTSWATPPRQVLPTGIGGDALRIVGTRAGGPSKG